jgi:wobble nucleotide-excising tRNase
VLDMGKTLNKIAQTLKDANKKVQLIYAFNGVGKTRLSREFKELIVPKKENEEQEEKPIKVIYYNAFTEDLFYWDNDLEEDTNRELLIRPNKFTHWVFNEQGQDNNIIQHFQHYTNNKLTPRFNEDYSKITFTIDKGNDDTIDNIKISKGEESCLIWCTFYCLITQIIDILNVIEPEDQETDKFNNLKYIFIDDPVSSLDENHLIELAVDIATLIKSNESDVKFIITTHNPLFYNVLYNEFNCPEKRSGYKEKHSIKYRLEKFDDGTYELHNSNDSPFSYHLFLLSELEKAIQTGKIQKYHYNFLRQILEKTSTFLGYEKWPELLELVEGDAKAYYNRIINKRSHAKDSGEETSHIDDSDRRVIDFLVKQIKGIYHFKDNQPHNNNANGTV